MRKQSGTITVGFLIVASLLAGLFSIESDPTGDTGKKIACPACNPDPDCFPGDPCAQCG